jgi:hypothetical protein
MPVAKPQNPRERDHRSRLNGPGRYGTIAGRYWSSSGGQADFAKVGDVFLVGYGDLLSAPGQFMSGDQAWPAQRRLR